jgi:DNA-binding NtrC family response regulator
MSLVYIVDDEENMCKVLKFCLEEDGHEVVYFTDPEKALIKLQEACFINDSPSLRPDIIVSDLKMPRMDGIAFLSELKKLDGRVPLIMMTAYASVQNAVEAMKEGAFDYILKPFEPDELKLLIKKAIEHTRLIEENISLKSISGEVNFIGTSQAVKNVFEMITSVANSKTTVLITGESGTGKELVARLIHNNSDRLKKPFVKINCAAIPDTLLESELFGHKKGAFTGATGDKIGKFELADSGTIFLDEIGDMNLNLQSKLLRVIQERQFEKIGCNKSVTVDVRIVAATNQNLQKMIGEGAFREDLYYRLNVFPIKIPPLRERKEDIIPIAEHFIREFNREFKKNVVKISDEMKNFILSYSFPGNVRELSNMIERAMILAKGNEININHFDKSDFYSGGGVQPKDNAGGAIYNGNSAADKVNDSGIPDASLEQIERQHIIDILKSTSWHKGKAAEILKIDRSTLYRMLKKYNITLKDE